VTVSTPNPSAPGFGETSANVFRVSDRAREETVLALRQCADMIEAGAVPELGGIMFTNPPDDPSLVHIVADMYVRRIPRP
jgi:hypothetical protein